MRRITAQHLAAAISVYFVLLALAYAAVTPPFEAPDEGSHFLYIHNLLETHQLPVLEDKAATYASKSVQRHHPPLYYLIGAALISWTQRGDVLHTYLQDNPFAAIGTVTDNNQNVFLHSPQAPPDQTLLAVGILRLYSTALAVGTLWCVYLTGRWAFGNPVGLMAMALVASMPMFIFISASVNNDNLVTLCYAAGVCWCVRMWRKMYLTPHLPLHNIERGQDTPPSILSQSHKSTIHHYTITRWEMIAISLILAAAALSKLTGLTLFGVVYLVLVYGAMQRRWSWRQATLVIGGSLIVTALLAGWWYLRNWTLYGDPLALQATLRVWARGPEPAPWGDVLADMPGVWQSFWMILGHFNIRGPDWLYIYADGAVTLGLTGLLVAGWRSVRTRHEAPLRNGGEITAFLVIVCGVVLVSLLISTRQINVSQGRILFPALMAFAPLLAVGWLAWLGTNGRGERPYGAILVFPMAVVAIVTPGQYLARAYAPAEPITVVPAAARRLDAQAGSLKLLAYQVDQDTAAPGDVLRVWLYIQGERSDNPALFVTALNPEGEPTGSLTTYPGMAPTSALDPATIYRVPVTFRLANAVQAPYQMQLAVGWLFPGDPQIRLTLTNAQNKALDGLVVPGATLVDMRYTPPAPRVATDVVYSDVIRLAGYTLSANEVTAGNSLSVTLDWGYVAPMDTDWTVALGILDADNKVITSADGMPPGYPTSAWRPAPNFPDTRTLTIPSGTPPGDYKLYVGWYRLSDGERLQPRGTGVEGNLFEAAVRVKQ